MREKKKGEVEERAQRRRRIIILAYTSETIRRRLHRHFRLSIPTPRPYPRLRRCVTKDWRAA